ncbi:hypothetical protein EVAR_54042_1 [Eumeta japonica]|uniref:Uncharacterized protein n=1 Tax=Eumeta variegata TaxID=151549 RepID=A0A4C1YTY9_EUMVA|nr:hypothetical protein EVAR_54042_1 [Eumeta japonica]
MSSRSHYFLPRGDGLHRRFRQTTTIRRNKPSLTRCSTTRFHTLLRPSELHIRYVYQTENIIKKKLCVESLRAKEVKLRNVEMKIGRATFGNRRGGRGAGGAHARPTYVAAAAPDRLIYSHLNEYETFGGVQQSVTEKFTGTYLQTAAVTGTA